MGARSQSTSCWVVAQVVSAIALLATPIFSSSEFSATGV